MRAALRTAVFSAMVSTGAFAAETPVQAMPLALAQQVVQQTVGLVESRGLYPRQQAEYEQAKAALLAVFDGQPADIERRTLYARIGKLLATLDANGHSFLKPPSRQLQIPRKPAAPDDLPPPIFQLLETAHGTVLRWAPPPVVNGGPAAIAPYLKRFQDEAAAIPDAARACALVVDLSEQSGGNAWPVFVAMLPLFGEANNANRVNRDGKRMPVVSRATLEEMNRQFGDGRGSPLARFADGPLAVVTARRTASAGEMVLIALLGEARVQSFGTTTYGMTTSNASLALADGSSLVLSVARYALGDGPVYREGVAPMHPIGPGESTSDGVAMAAKWVAANTPRCGAANKLATSGAGK